MIEVDASAGWKNRIAELMLTSKPLDVYIGSCASDEHKCGGTCDGGSASRQARDRIETNSHQSDTLPLETSNNHHHNESVSEAASESQTLKGSDTPKTAYSHKAIGMPAQMANTTAVEVYVESGARSECRKGDTYDACSAFIEAKDRLEINAPHPDATVSVNSLPLGSNNNNLHNESVSEATSESQALMANSDTSKTAYSHKANPAPRPKVNMKELEQKLAKKNLNNAIHRRLRKHVSDYLSLIENIRRMQVPHPKTNELHKGLQAVTQALSVCKDTWKQFWSTIPISGAARQERDCSNFLANLHNQPVVKLSEEADW